MYQLCYYVPIDEAERVAAAVFQTGAGKIGDYDCCCWQTEGRGQFRPLEGSDPFLGKHGKLEKVAEFKVEMVCDAECIHAAVAALKKAHPYEEPAYHVVKLEDF